MKITLENLKPRNPLVTLARSRRAGMHRRAAGGMRQQARRALQRELEHPPHIP